MGVRAGEVSRVVPVAAGTRGGRWGGGARLRPGSSVRIRCFRRRLWLQSCEPARTARGRDRRGVLPVSIRNPGCRRRHISAQARKNVTYRPLSRAYALLHVTFNRVSKGGAGVDACRSPCPGMIRTVASPQIPSLTNMRSRDSIFFVLSLVAASVAHAAATDDGAWRRQPSRRLVYRGPAACDGCPETIAQRLRESDHQFRVIYVGPRRNSRSRPPSGRRRALCPAGRRAGHSGAAASIGKNSIRAVRHYVSNGGRYLGICMGAYLAGDPGFGLVAGEFDSEVGRPADAARDRGHGDAGGLAREKRWIYFQDGAMLPAALARSCWRLIRTATSRRRPIATARGASSARIPKPTKAGIARTA